MRYPVEDTLGPTSFMYGRPAFEFSEDGHEKWRVSKPACGFIRVNLFHVPCLRVLTEVATLGSFQHRAMKRVVTVIPLPGAHRS